LAGFNTI